MMDSIRDLLGFFLKISVAIFLLVFVIWIVGSIPPAPGKVGGTFGVATTSKFDYLPSPRAYSGFFSSSSTNISKPKVFEAPESYIYTGAQAFSETVTSGNKGSGTNSVNGYSYNTYTYPLYTYEGTNGIPVVVSSSPSASTPSQASSSALVVTPLQRTLYIRNLSIYERGHVYTGLSFIGEARSTLFRDGKFPIVVVDGNGRVVGVSAAVATTQWSVPGWVRFAAKIDYALPNNILCTMVFEEALASTERSRQPLRVPVPVMCN
jgi:hypothetical protein